MRALTLKYRPKTFEEVIGQSIVTKIIKKAIEAGALKNSILLCGKSGCGKTTLARIIANMLNRGAGSPIEIDAASNGGVENIRAIIESANQRSLTSTYKVFIIDECHAISTAGWQAFLKGIEEPAEYTYYIFCTTEPNKIPATILNRVQRYNIAPISIADIKTRLSFICEQEKFTNYKDCCDFIAKMSRGEMRAAITYLEQCADYSTDLSINNVKAVLGDLSYESMMHLTNLLIDGNLKETLKFVDNQAANGVDIKQFINSYLEFSIDLCKYILFNDISMTNIPEYLDESNEDGVSPIKYTVGINDNLNWFSKLSEQLFELKSFLRNDQDVISSVKVFLMKICRGI